MAHGEAKVVIRRPAKEVLDFVMDLHEYRKIDKKLGVIRWLKAEVPREIAAAKARLER